MHICDTHAYIKQRPSRHHTRASLTQQSLVTHIFSALTTTGSDKWFVAKPLSEPMVSFLSIGISGTYFSENLIEIQTFPVKKMHLKMSPAKCRRFFQVSCQLISTVCNIYPIKSNNLPNIWTFRNWFCMVSHITRTGSTYGVGSVLINAILKENNI